MKIPYPFDREAAVQLAGVLEREGNLHAAMQLWWRICAVDPYAHGAREKVAELTYDINASLIRPGNDEGAELLLRIIALAPPTARLAAAYFEILGKRLESQPRRQRPGSVVLGLGSGRCGTTTLSYAMTGVAQACATHENPPMFYWRPLEAQLSFHIQRFRILRQYFAIVFDAAYWWLNSQPRILAEFSDAKVIGLYRETEACVESFMTQKGFGKGSLNHWATWPNDIWAASPGDPSLPSYEIPPTADSDPDAAKRAMLRRYVSEYNESLVRLAAAQPQRVLLVRTEDLSDPDSYARMSDFLGCELRMPSVSLNVGTSSDSAKGAMMY
jgi:hypothetical protein